MTSTPITRRRFQGLFAVGVAGTVFDPARAARPGDQVLVMSNGGFGGIHDKLLAALTRPA